MNLLIFLFPVLLLLMPVPSQAGGAWGVTAIDTDGETGYNPSLAIDSQNRLHVAYNDWFEGDLRYAFFDGNTWHTETVDAEGLSGGTPSLALDAAGRAHISYFDFDQEELWYARQDGAGGWALELVDASTRTGIYSSIQIASDNRVHIAYQDLANGDLKYATRLDGGSWTIETVDAAGDVGQFASLALDSSGKPHIAYLDWGASTFDLKYAFKNPAWTVETAASSGWVGFYASLSIDASGTSHIAHQDAQGQNLMYSKKENGSWFHVAVDTAGDVGAYASLALDQNGRPHIAYYDAIGQKLKHARWSGTAWSTAAITGSGPESWDTSIAIDNNNNPHVAYLNWLRGDLQYARWSNAPLLSWTGEPGYVSDGLDPESGNSFTRFIFRVSYQDPDNDPALSGTPQLHLTLAGSSQPAAGSPFSMKAYSVSGSTTRYQHEAWLPGGNYLYRFSAKDRWGVEAEGAPVSLSSGPSVQDLGIPTGEDQVFAYPNPARGNKITFRVALTHRDPFIEIKIFDITGAPMRVVGNDLIPKHTAPLYEYTWDLKDDQGRDLASGVYIYLVKAKDRLTGQEFKTIKKLAILK